MLVLSRRPGERILIGDGIELTVVKVRGNRILLGIQAPLETEIRRAEIQHHVEEQEGPYDPAHTIEASHATSIHGDF